MEVINVEDYDPDNLSIDKPQKNEDINMYESSINYLSNDNLIIKTPKLKVVAIISEDDDVNLIADFTPQCENFYRGINNFDCSIKQKIVDNGELFFGAETNKKTINNLYKSNISLPISLATLPQITITIPIEQGKVVCNVIDKNNNPITLDDIKEDNEVMMIIMINRLCFYTDRCNIPYIAHTIKIFNKICQTEKYLFEEDT